MTKLEELAGLYGIQTSYRDMRQQLQVASRESLIAALGALGSGVRSMSDVDTALIERRRRLWERVVEPVLVAWNGKIPPIPIRLAASEPDLRIEGHLNLESGGSREVRTRLSRLRMRERETVQGTLYIRRELRIAPRLPLGYHELQLKIGARTYSAMIISAPMKAHFPFRRREWGVFVPVYSLHSHRSPNAGDLTEFENLIEWFGAFGGRVAATLPLLAAFLDRPFEPSPYAPASRLFWNEFYIDVGRRRRRRASPLVDYREEMQFRRRVLEEDAEAFFAKRNSQDRKMFDAFAASESRLDRYARFRAATEKHGGWRRWPQRIRDGEIRPGDFDAAVHRFHLYAQWRIQDQLGKIAQKTKRNGQMLYLDLPLGLHPDSYDTWQYRDLFVQDATGGAPPDPVFTKGQDWGFPPMHPEAMRLRRHDYTIAYIRNHLRYARLLRIDHVMGLHRLFWIPKGLTGAGGVYVEYPSEEIYAILSLESHRNQAGIVGENLGTVPPEVNQAMKRHNLQQMYVLQYEAAGSHALDAVRQVARNTVASLNTHDMVPFRGFLEGTDIEDRLDLRFLDESGAARERRERRKIKKGLIAFLRKRGLLKSDAEPTPGEVLKATMQFLAASMARVVLVNLEDLWEEVVPQNIPATHRERPNWRRHVRMRTDELADAEELSEILRMINRNRRSRGFR